MDTKYNMLFACKEHIEILLEEFVNRYEEPPAMDMLEEDKKTINCSWCKQNATYSIETLPKSEEETK